MKKIECITNLLGKYLITHKLPSVQRVKNIGPSDYKHLITLAHERGFYGNFPRV